MSSLSHRFVWDAELISRPILAVVALLSAQWVFFLWAIVGLMRTRTDERPSAVAILGLGLCFHILTLGAPPIQESDAYRYLWDGATLSQGVSPYQFCPNDILNAKSDSKHLPELTEEVKLFQTSGGRETLTRVSYPDTPTIYPPAAQFAFAVGYMLSGWSWVGLRILFIAAYFAGSGLLVAAMNRSSSAASGRASLAALLLGWCPLAVKEIANSTHLDALLVLYFGAIIYSLTRRKELAPVTFAVLIGVLFGLAILTKLYPLLILPVFLAWTARRYSWRISFILAATTLLSVTLGYAPFLLHDRWRVFEGFTHFSNEWLRNAGFFALLKALCTYVLGDRRLELPLLGGAGPLGTVAAKVTAQVLVLVVIAYNSVRAFKIRREQKELERLATLCAGVLFAWFLLLPMAYPWYLLGVTPFVVCAQPRVLPWLLIFSTGCFYYLLFYTEYHDLPVSYNAAISCIEYGLPVLAAACLFFMGPKLSRAEDRETDTAAAVAE